MAYQNVISEVTAAPCVPHIVLVLKWLFTIEDANPTFREDSSLVNVDKLRMVFLLVTNLESQQLYRYPFVGSRTELAEFVKCMPPNHVASDPELYEMSCMREKKSEKDFAKLSIMDTFRGAVMRRKFSGQRERQELSPLESPRTEQRAPLTLANINTCPKCLKSFSTKEHLVTHIQLECCN